MKLTDLEFNLMTTIAHNEMNTTNGATPKVYTDVNCYLWVDEFASELGVPMNVVKGALGSLTTKGAIWIINEPKREDDGVGFTEAGFDAWAAAKSDNYDAGMDAEPAGLQ